MVVGLRETKPMGSALRVVGGCRYVVGGCARMGRYFEGQAANGDERIGVNA